MGKVTKKEDGKRVPFNWVRLKSMWDQGKSYLDMAKTLDAHYNPDGDDPTKSIRAKCSVAMTKGIKLDGKVVRFKRRSKVNTTKEAKPKATATATKQAKKPSTKATAQKPKAPAKKQAKKPAKAVALTPSPDKTTTPPTEA